MNLSDGSALFNGPFSTSDPLQKRHPSLQGFKGFHINQVTARDTMLSDKNRFTVAFELGEQLSGFAFQGGYELGAHTSDTNVPLSGLQGTTLPV